MNDYILFMHDDAPPSALAGQDEAWGRYLASLRATGRFSGGSSIGGGACFHKSGSSNRPTAAHLTGYLRIQAESLEAARDALVGNPVFEAGGTVEIRELPRD